MTRSERKGELVRLSAADPLNLSGVILAGKRVPALRTNSIVLRDGLIGAAEPTAQPEAPSPVLAGEEADMVTVPGS